jgi:hypothetical protein
MNLTSYIYKRKEWLRYREACLKNAGYACERCLRTDVILQVHHPEYVSGKQPWEYPIEFSEVLCRRCHAEIHGIIKPSGGWTILYSDLDNNEPSDPIACENCGEEIRWHFTIYHPEWGEIVVGSECAENLSLGPEIKKLKSFQRRLQTFIVSPRWTQSPKGYWITYQGHSALVYKSGNFYRLKIDNKWGEKNYRTIEDAKHRAFLKINSEINKGK